MCPRTGRDSGGLCASIYPVTCRFCLHKLASFPQDDRMGARLFSKLTSPGRLAQIAAKAAWLIAMRTMRRIWEQTRSGRQFGGQLRIGIVEAITRESASATPASLRAFLKASEITKGNRAGPIISRSNIVATSREAISGATLASSGNL
jgi:hypothetical protein